MPLVSSSGSGQRPHVVRGNPRVVGRNPRRGGARRLASEIAAAHGRSFSGAKLRRPKERSSFRSGLGDCVSRACEDQASRAEKAADYLAHCAVHQAHSLGISGEQERPFVQLSTPSRKIRPLLVHHPRIYAFPGSAPRTAENRKPRANPVGRFPCYSPGKSPAGSCLRSQGPQLRVQLSAWRTGPFIRSFRGSGGCMRRRVSSIERSTGAGSGVRASMRCTRRHF